jgi:Tol biopolymer transport system component
MLGRTARWLVSCAFALATIAAAASPAQAAFPGVPGPIAYSKHILNEGSGDSGGIVTHGPRKSQGVHDLTSDANDSSPSYSANGRMIVFSGNRDPVFSNATHIYLMNADGSGVTALTSGENYDSNPSFSPNGQQVVFDRAALGFGRVTHIFVVNVDGSGLHQLTNDAGHDYDPTFTPNGRRILFVSNRDTDAGSDHSDIFSMKPSGAQMQVLIDGPRDEYDPDVSPNGRRIAFASNRDHGPNIFVAKANGRRARELTHSRHDCFGSACYVSPSWAPDGKHIAFLRLGRYSSELEVMRPDGTQDRSFDDAGRDPEGFGTSIGSPSWGVAPR